MFLHKWLNQRPERVIAFMLCWGMPVFVHAQSLNDVVTEQLSRSCTELLGNDDFLTVLTGPLQEICAPPIVGGPGVPPGAVAGSRGGGAAIPTGLPNILRRRLAEDEKENGNEGGGASSDYVLGLSESVEVFLSGEYQSLDRDITKFEDGYDSDIWRVTTGADYRIHETMLVGAAFDYRHQKGGFSGGGNFTMDSYGTLVYANITPLDGLFIQVVGSYAHQDNERSRFTRFEEEDGPIHTGFADSDYQSDEYSASIQSGYDFNFQNLTLTPIVGLDWIRNNYASFSESGNSGLELRISKDRRVSLQSRLGVLGSLAFGTEFGVIVPQVGVTWLHEFENDQRDIQFSFVGDTRNKLLTFQNEKPDRDFLEFNVGTSVVFAHGIQTFINYRAIAGHQYFNSHSASVGLRVEF